MKQDRPEIDFGVIRIKFLVAGMIGLFFVIGFVRWVLTHA
jgi:hypothetical protein